MVALVLLHKALDRDARPSRGANAQSVGQVTADRKPRAKRSPKPPLFVRRGRLKRTTQPAKCVDAPGHVERLNLDDQAAEGITTCVHWTPGRKLAHTKKALGGRSGVARRCWIGRPPGTGATAGGLADLPEEGAHRARGRAQATGCGDRCVEGYSWLGGAVLHSWAYCVSHCPGLRRHASSWSV